MAGETKPGRLVAGRYRLVRKLGSGGMGRVWSAHDETLGIDVAVKEVWLPEVISAEEQAQRLARAEREARNAARLRDHPNIVAVYDVAVDGGVPWTVMQLVEGRSLADHLEAYGPLSVENAGKVARALLHALEAAHAAGVVHRDVKPANVMLAKTGDVLLTDFGIAVHQADTALTATGSFLGSVEYIAPERARGNDGQAASDLFSLGVTLYHAVEGFSPFRRDTATGCLTAVLFEQAPVPKRAGRLTRVINGLLEKEPERRLTPAGAVELLDVASAATSQISVAPGASAARIAATSALGASGLGTSGSGTSGSGTSDSGTGPRPVPQPPRAPATAAAEPAAPAPAAPGPSRRHAPAARSATEFRPDTSRSRQPEPRRAGKHWRRLSIVVGSLVGLLAVLAILGALAHRRDKGVGPGSPASPAAQGLPNPCQVPADLLTRLQLGAGTGPGNNAAERRCTWWTDPGAQTPYTVATLATRPGPYAKDPASHPVQVGGVTGAEFTTRPTDVGATLLCTVEWPTAFGYDVATMKERNRLVSAADLCKAAEDWANGAFPAVSR